VALADKFDTLCGLFGIGQLPTGDRDPFALRRHALGVIRILIEKNMGLGLTQLIEAGFAAFPPDMLDTGAASKLAEFIFDRLANQLREQGYSAQQVDAVLALRPERLKEVPRLLDAVRTFAGMPEAVSLASANKRVGNILKKVEGGVSAEVDASRLAEPAEVALHAALQSVKPAADLAFEAGDYTGSLKALAALKGPVDEFFDKVMVNAEDAQLRTNRQGLLALLHATMNRAADLSRLAA
jgi:glycyl-tRNA synthetase beta chain